MEYSRLPVNCIKPVTEFIRDQEDYFAGQHGEVTTRKATAADIAEIEAELAAKAKIPSCITAELGVAPKKAKKPQCLGPQYNPMKFAERAG